MKEKFFLNSHLHIPSKELRKQHREMNKKHSERIEWANNLYKELEKESMKLAKENDRLWKEQNKREWKEFHKEKNKKRK